MSLVTCSGCHAPIEPSAASCPLCGRPNTAPPTNTARPTNTAPPLPVPTSPWSTTPVPPPWEPPAPAPAAPAPVLRARRWPIVLGILGSLAILGVALWVIDLPRDDALAEADWRTYETKSGRYLVDLPGVATRLDEVRDVAGVTFPIDALVVGDGGFDRLAPGAFFLEVELEGLLPPGALTTDPELTRTVLEAQARAAFGAAGIDWAATSDAGFPRGPAIALDGSVPGQDLVVRAFVALDATTAVGAIVVQPSDQVDTAETMLTRIVDSVT